MNKNGLESGRAKEKVVRSALPIGLKEEVFIENMGSKARELFH